MAIDATPVLPGFQSFVADSLDRPGNVDLTDEKYTGENLLRDYPKVYAAIARALFYYRLPTRTIRDLFHVNGKIVAAIREHMIAASATDGRAAFLVRSRVASQRDIVVSRLLDSIETKLAEKDGSVDITTLIGWLKDIQAMKSASNGVERKPLAKNETYDLDDYDAVINGLVEEKKSARMNEVAGSSGEAAGSSGEVAGSSGENCSTGS